MSRNHWRNAAVEQVAFPSLSDNINVRGEISTFDGDAQSANVALVYRPRTAMTTASLPKPSEQPASKPDFKPLPKPTPKPLPEPTPEPVPAPEPVQKPKVIPAPDSEAKLEIIPIPKPDVVTAPRPEKAPEPKPVPVPDTAAEPKPAPKAEPVPLPKPVEPQSNMIAKADCLSPSVNEPVDANGCALFSGVQEGLDFQAGSAVLTASASRVLDELAQNLKNNPATVIEIQGHTDLQRNATLAKSLAKQRVFEVARQLVQRGVSVKRLRARAFGSSEPVAPNATTQGRRMNNRIVLRVLR